MKNWLYLIVCFCDLPLSNLSEHLNFYGNYGIGLTKEWGIGKGINPVIYLSQASELNIQLAKLRTNPILKKERTG
jgi:Putative abortive phage resistance protein AbiGi, antitoxin